jgi:hypothetical protein
MVIKQMHGSPSRHIGPADLLEAFNGRKVWEGRVEVFGLLNHPQAKRCYAWSDFDSKQEHITAVLELPPVKNANDAVKAYIVQQVKQARKKQ